MGERVNKLLVAIDPVGKDVPQFGEAVLQAFQQRDRAMDILNVGGMDVNSQQQAIGIGDDVSLAPVDAFGIVAARATSLGGRGTLAVDDRGRRCWLTSAPPKWATYLDLSSRPTRLRGDRYESDY